MTFVKKIHIFAVFLVKMSCFCWKWCIFVKIFEVQCEFNPKTTRQHTAKGFFRLNDLFYNEKGNFMHRRLLVLLAAAVLLTAQACVESLAGNLHPRRQESDCALTTRLITQAVPATFWPQELLVCGEVAVWR